MVSMLAISIRIVHEVFPELMMMIFCSMGFSIFFIRISHNR